MRKASTLAGAAIAVLLACGAARSPAATTVYSVDQLRNALYGASPGDRIYVAPGNYNSRLYVSGVHGQPGNMIEVVALDPANRPVFTSDDYACFTLINSSYISVDGIVAHGAGTLTQAGNNIEFALSHHMILKNSHSGLIPHLGNADGVKFASSNNILMYNTTVEEWGEGGSAVDAMNNHNSLFMRNTITYPSAPIGVAGNGFQSKGSYAYESGFYKNRFEDGSARAQKLGGWGGSSGWEAYDMVVMGNTYHLGEAAVSFESSTNCTFAYNTVVDPEKWVMRILQGGGYETAFNHFDRNLVKYGPFLLWGGIQNISANTRPETFTYDENYWYDSTQPGTIPTLCSGCVQIAPAGGVDPQLDADHRPWYGPAMEYGAHAPAMEAEFEQYAGWFQWAWDQAQLFEPKAEPGGPYEIGPGGTITLDAGGSYAGAGSYGPYSFDSLLWDINRDGTPDAAGLGADVTYDDLLLLGMGFGTHTVELKAAVTNEYNTIWDLGFAELSIVNHPALSGDGNADNVVDGLDYVVWSNHYEECGHPAWSDGGWAVGNYTEDDCVDGLDYVVWSNNYLQGLPASPGAVPEPTSALLLAVGLACLRRRLRG